MRFFRVDGSGRIRTEFGTLPGQRMVYAFHENQAQLWTWGIPNAYWAAHRYIATTGSWLPTRA